MKHVDVACTYTWHGNGVWISIGFPRSLIGTEEPAADFRLAVWSGSTVDFRSFRLRGAYRKSAVAQFYHGEKNMGPHSYPAEFPSYVHAISRRTCLYAGENNHGMHASLLYTSVRATRARPSAKWEYTLHLHNIYGSNAGQKISRQCNKNLLHDTHILYLFIQIWLIIWKINFIYMHIFLWTYIFDQFDKMRNQSTDKDCWIA